MNPIAEREEIRSRVRLLQAEGGLRRLVGRPFPSADRLRHVRYAFHDDALFAEAQARRPAG